MLTIPFFVIPSLLAVYMGKIPLKKPLKTVDIYFYNFVCMAFWLKWFRPEPHKSKSGHFSLLPATHPQWQYKLAGTDAEPHGISVGVSGVSLRTADLVNMVGPSLVHAVGDLHLPDLYSPLSFMLLVSSLRRDLSLLCKMQNLFQVLFLIIWYI